MRWSRISFDRAIDVLLQKTHQGCADMHVRTEINPLWLLPEYLKDDVPGMHMLEFDDKTVLLHFATFDPNLNAPDKPQYWLGEPI